jgi:hypothetical protein
LSISIIPLDPRIRLDGIGLPFAIGVNELDGNEIAVRHAVSICNSEWVFEYSSNRTPDIDDLVSSFVKLVSIIR